MDLSSPLPCAGWRPAPRSLRCRPGPAGRSRPRGAGATATAPMGSAGVRVLEPSRLSARRQTVGCPDDRADGGRASLDQLRPEAGRQGRLAADPSGRGARADRAVGLRQDDAAAVAQSPHRAHPERVAERPDHARRRRHLRARADGSAPPRDDGLPAAQSVSDERLRQRRLRSARAGHGASRDGRRCDRRSRRRSPGRDCWRRSGTTSTIRRYGSPAGSSSGSASPERSLRIPRCCCSTSRARRSTRSRRT